MIDIDIPLPPKQIDDHFREHPDPIVRMHDCEFCGASVRRALNVWSEMYGTPIPDDPEKLVRDLRRIAVGLEPV